MKQVLRKGFGEIIVDRVPDPELAPHQVLIRPLYSLISSGTETASIHQESMLKEVAEKPSHLKKIWEVMKLNGPLRTMAEVKAKFSDYAVLGYSGAGIVVDHHRTVTDIAAGERAAYGGEGTGHGEAIATGRNLVARVPEGVPFEHACFATLGSIALNAVRVAGIGTSSSYCMPQFGAASPGDHGIVGIAEGCPDAMNVHRRALARVGRIERDRRVHTVRPADVAER
jgi:hypothetical protein